MKICLINNLYKPYAKGGAEKVVEMTAKALVRSGHDVFIISTKPRSAKYEKVTADNVGQIKNYYLKSFYFDLGKMPIIIRLFWRIYDMFDIITASKVSKILISEKPDLVITNNLTGLSYLIPKKINSMGIRSIHFLHDVQLYYPSGIIFFKTQKKQYLFYYKIYYGITRFLFDDVKEVISSSNWLMDEYTKRGFFLRSKKIILETSPDHLYDDRPTPQRSEIYRKQNENEFNFLFAGQIEVHKGIVFLIEYFNKFSIKFPNLNVKLLIAGNGSQIKKAKFLANDKTYFLDNLTHEEILQLMKKVDCLIMPSLCFENSPMVIFEAIASNLPILASRIGGITELIHKYGGALFLPDNGEEMIDKIKWIATNYESFKKNATSRYVKSNNFSKDLADIIS